MSTFDNQWYLTCASSLAIGVSMHIGFYYFFQFMIYVQSMCWRWHDRSFSFNIVDDSKIGLDKDAEQEDGEQTAKTRQNT